MLALSTDASIIDFRLDFHHDHFNIKRVNHGGLHLHKSVQNYVIKFVKDLRYHRSVVFCESSVFLLQ
jgi:hypothetical protein